MSHAAEGSLQAYLDGEVDGPAAAGLRAHLAACAECASELELLRVAGVRTHQALALLDSDAPVPMLRARAAIAVGERARRPRGAVLRLGGWGIAKAAMLVLVLAGAGAAAIPDVRRAFEATFARVAELFGASRTAEITPEAPLDVSRPEPAVLEVRQAFVQPVAGRVRVLLPAQAPGVEVTVRLIDGNRASVETASTGQVRFVSSTGRLEVFGVEGGSITIGVPRMIDNATVEVDGRVRVIKEGNQLVLSGPATAERGSELRFITGF
jgi:anti-sigma factor RsiW